MQFSDAFFLEADLRSLVGLFEQFDRCVHEYRTLRSIQDNTESAGWQPCPSRPERITAAARSLQSCRTELGEVIVSIRKQLAQLTATDDTAMWRSEVSTRLSPAITALSNVYGSKIEIHHDLGEGPPIDDVLVAIHKWMLRIRDHGQYLTDLTSNARRQAAVRLAEQYSLTDTLVNLSRRGDVRQLTPAEIRQNDPDRPQHSVGDPFADAMMWVHARCSWADGRRNGGELFDYVGALARGDELNLDPSVRDDVVKQLRELDTTATRRELWESLLIAFPHLTAELAGVDASVAAGAKPKYDIERRELRIAGQVVKRFRQPAKNQETVLKTFEEDDWPDRIDDPLKQGKLAETIRSLNDHMIREDLIRFSGDGSREAVLWTLVADAPVEHPH